MPIHDELNALTATEALAGIAAREFSAPEYLAACHGVIERRDPTVQAWVALRDAETDPVPHTGLFKGLPVGVKDIYDTRDFPTTWGTGYMHSERSVSDAAVVSMLKCAGAVLMGKTVSTEFAYFTPGKTRNPHDPDRTPGGSSSGSAASVADGMVPIAVGTQTAGSITRPASYCGVIGYKPTYGLVPTAGIKQFSDLLDTPGYFARSMPDIALVHAALTTSKMIDLSPANQPSMTIAVQRLPSNGPLDTDMEGALLRVEDQLRKSGHSVKHLDLPKEFDELLDHQITIMAYEAARALRDEHVMHAADMGSKLVELIERGLDMPLDEYITACRETRRRCRELEERMQDVDIVLSPSAVGEAPKGHDGTGDPLYSRVWTLSGLPTVSLPLERGRNGMPLGMQCVGHRYGDHELMRQAHQLMRQWRYPNGIVPAVDH